MKKAVIVSGYFNPLHKGHIEYFKLAKAQADVLFVIVNNDFQRELKKSKEFMFEDERCLIINEIKVVDKVFLSIDKDKSVCMFFPKLFRLHEVKLHYQALHYILPLLQNLKF